MIDQNNKPEIYRYTAKDMYSIISRGGGNGQNQAEEVISIEDKENRISEFLDGGKHINDTYRFVWHDNKRRLFQDNKHNPRKYLMNKIHILGLENLPCTMGTTITNK